MQARKLDVMDIMACVENLYKGIADRTKCNDVTGWEAIVVWTNLFNGNERAALVVFMKVQDNWQNPLRWRELRRTGTAVMGDK